MRCIKRDDYKEDANIQNFANLLKIWDERMEIKRKKSEYDETVEDFYNLLKFWDQRNGRSINNVNNNHNLGLFSKEPKNRIVSERIASENLFNYKKNDQNGNKEKEIKQNEEKNKNIINNKSKELNLENMEIKNYEKNYSEEGFWDKIKKYALKINAKPIYVALLLFYSIPKVTLVDKAIIIGALGYLISPFDLIPDAIPFIGFMDDIAVLMLAFHAIVSNIDNEIKQKAKNKFKPIFKDFDDEKIEKLLN